MVDWYRVHPVRHSGQPPPGGVTIGPALTAFAVVFVAELGDRTQLLLLALATRHRAGPVVGGLVVGYGLMTILAVALGAAVGSALPDDVVRIGSGLAFLGFALWTLLGDEDEDDDRVDDRSQRHPVALLASIAGMIMVSEIGDKSMLATATLATDGDPVAVWAGATTGILSAGGLGVVAGRVLADRVDPDVLRWVSAGLFTVFGVLLLIGVL